MSSLPSAEVAADFKDALQDLKVNSRPEINVLTVIAKENTEHAQAISRELENHIRTTRPEYKLPALYVLDSIVKNVGTPYTVYLSRDLFRTFMDAYTLVDPPTRKAMEGLLKTWKQPVPESLDTRPVFPHEITREIDNALIKYRTVAIQHQQQAARSQRQVQVPVRIAQATLWRDTPTPPQPGMQYPHAQSFDVQYGTGSTTITQDPRRPQQFPISQPPPVVPSPILQQATPVTAGAALPYAQPPARYSTPIQYSAPALQPAFEQVPPSLIENVRQLIVSATIEAATNPTESRTQALLQTLKGLQRILETQQLVSDQILIIQAEVSRISEVFQKPPPQTINASTFQQGIPALQALQPGTPSFSSASPALPLAVSITPSATPTLQGSIPALPPLTPAFPSATPAFPSAAPAPSLAQLLHQFNPNLTPQPSLPQPAPVPTPAAAPAPTDLLSTLRAAGILPGGSVLTPSNNGVPRVQPAEPVKAPFAGLRNDVRMNAASLKIPRPHLIASLYEARPNQCRQCGRRFPSTEEGRKMKERHLDWHFQINTRVADNAKAVVNRSWYIDEMEWIKYREQDDAALAPASDDPAKAGPGGTAAKKDETKEHYVPVPIDASQANTTCPICQEKFEVIWHREAEQPVWTDAIKVGQRTYHASCYAEVSKGNEFTGAGRSTPDSVLGKRKSETDHERHEKFRIVA